MRAEEPDVKMRLLKAAKRLFARQGYEGTSVRQICEEAGANVALVSYHFGGKENMFQALFETFFPHAQIAEFTKTQYDPVEGLRTIIREVMLFHQEEPEMIILLNQEIAMNSPRIEVIRRNANPVWLQLKEMLREGREKGVYRFRSLDHTLMTVLGNILFHKQRNYFTPILSGEPRDPMADIEDTIAYVLRGLEYNGD
ncbi:TetR/AcrR family transcriptional regulator [Paenibacillus xanthanilyticus]|uniref:TetR/AcrR family transcriptional regulator n=1 Tax=Paenibacillus xanthanilyticus TaxID=1783531 RepID=A0ABV8K4F0_9BACL